MEFCTLVNCIDGRTQIPAITWLRRRVGAAHVDVVTEAGLVGVLSGDPESVEARSIFHRIEVSLRAHDSKAIAVAAHHDCAGNPVPDAEQKRQIQLCRELLSNRYPDLAILGVWLDESWSAHECQADP